MRNDTKLARIRKAMRDEDWERALRLAAKFHRLGEHAEAIQRAASALANPTLYEDLGYDLKQVKAEGIKALKERYSTSWKVVQEENNDQGD
jgi:hypothetical protein